MVPKICPKTRISTIKICTWRLKKKKKRFLVDLNTNTSKRKNERKKNKNKNKRTRWWLSNGGGSTSRCRDTGGDMAGLLRLVAVFFFFFNYNSRTYFFLSFINRCCQLFFPLHTAQVIT